MLILKYNLCVLFFIYGYNLEIKKKEKIEILLLIQINLEIREIKEKFEIL